MSSNPIDRLNQRVAAITGPTAPDLAVLAAFAAQEFTGESAGGLVTATVTGTKQLVRLDVLVTATRGENREALGANTVTAVNAALAAADAARGALLGMPSGDLAAHLEQTVEAFSERMDALIGQLDALRARRNTD